MPSRPSSSRLIASHRSRTRDAVRASASPNTCGCRETSFAWMPRAAASRSPAPRSERSSARKNDWKRRSPTSSSSFASSPPRAASATSYASSTVCGTIVRAVCSRSQGQSRRSRSVSCCSSSSASASKLGGGGLRRRSRGRLVAGLVGRLLRELLPLVVPPAGHLVLLLLLEELLLDRRLDLIEGDRPRLRGGLHRAERLNHVPPELRVHGLRNLMRLQPESCLLERSHGLERAADCLLLADRQQTATRLAWIDRVFARERREVAAVLQLVVDRQRERLLLDEDMPHRAAFRLPGLLVLLLMVVVVLLGVVV